MANFSLEGQRVLVTGGGSGIGRAIAIAMARAGARVVVNYLTGEDQARAVVAGIEREGGVAAAIRADVSTAEGCDTLFTAAAQRFGRLDILVANAGIQRDAPFAAMTLEQWRQVIDLNLTGQFLCGQHAVRQFRRQPRPVNGARAIGKIIFTSSVHQAIPWAGHANYAASKGGLKLLMETMAQELAPEGIRVNAIAPGAIKTQINRPAWETPEAAARLLELIPYGRLGEPEDVAKAAVWLASEDSDYVVGTTLVVDGGMMLYPAFRSGG